MVVNLSGRTVESSNTAKRHRTGGKSGKLSLVARTLVLQPFPTEGTRTRRVRQPWSGRRTTKNSSSRSGSAITVPKGAECNSAVGSQVYERRSSGNPNPSGFLVRSDSKNKD